MKKRLLIIATFGLLILSGCGSKNTTTDSGPFEELPSNEEVVVDSDITEEIISAPANPSSNYTPVPKSALDIELDLIEIESTFLQDELKQDITTAQMNTISRDLYSLWDDELNSLWSRLWEVADRPTKDSVLAEQREWIASKENASKLAGKKYEGGSLQGIISTQKAAKLTRLRCYEIASYLGKLTDVSVTMPVIDYDGLYVDTQGTMEAYSDLTVQKATDDFYEIEIGVYRLTTLNGYATIENGILKFVDESMNYNIKGDIIVEDESATFSVTESEWEELPVGTTIDFDEKWD